MENIALSIITVVDNLDEFKKNALKNLLLSIKTQSLENFEHIIVDTGDNSVFLNDFKEAKIIKDDSGMLSCAHKSGVDASSGKFLLFMESYASLASKDTLRLALNAINEAKADFSYSSCKYYLPSGQNFGKSSPFLGAFFMRQPFSINTMIFKRELFEKINGFDENFKNNFEYDFILRLILSGAKPVELQDTFANVIVRPKYVKKVENKKDYYDIYIKNYKNMKFFDLKTYENMYKTATFPKSLIECIQKKCYPIVQFKMDEFFDKFAADEGNAYAITKIPFIDFEVETSFINILNKPLIKKVRRKNIVTLYIFKIPFFVYFI